MTILFDMDGVLVDSEPVILEAAIAALREYGVSAQPDDFLPFIGAGEDRFVGGVAEKYGATYRLEMKKKTYEKYAELAPRMLKIYPETVQTLTALQAAGYPLGLASSADREKIDVNLSVAHIPPSLFGAIVSGSETSKKKPAPDLYLSAAQRLGAKPEDCLVIEDAINGILAAQRAGMKCAALTTSFSQQELAAYHPDIILASLAQLPAYVETLAQESGR